MAKHYSPSSFRFEIGGLPVGQFDALRVDAHPTRDVPVQELTRMMNQQRAVLGGGRFQVVLLRGRGSRAALMASQAAPRGKPGVLEFAAVGAAPPVRIKLKNVQIVSYQTSGDSAGSGTDIAIEKVVIQHEGVLP